jgi:hypothetical protein
MREGGLTRHAKEAPRVAELDEVAEHAREWCLRADFRCAASVTVPLSGNDFATEMP